MSPRGEGCGAIRLLSEKPETVPLLEKGQELELVVITGWVESFLRRIESWALGRCRRL
jgi:hypothetical protein